MAHHQLGRHDEAGNWYDRAVAWMDKNRSGDEELRRYPTEAEELVQRDKKHPPEGEPRSCKTVTD